MRPAFFGEVQLPGSRAVDVEFGDDFEEQIASRNRVKIDQKTDLAKWIHSVEYLIVANGVQPSNFLNVHVIPNQPKSELAFVLSVSPRKEDGQGQEETENPTPPTSTMDFYYVADTKSLIGITSSKYPPTAEASLDVVSKIFDLVAPSLSSLKVFVLDFKSSAAYRTFDRTAMEDRLTTYGIIRTLTTSKEKSMNKDDGGKFIQLEMPNMVDGLSGAVLTHCELKNIRAMTIILYGPESSVGSNINTYRTYLERAEPWKSVFFSKNNEAAIRAKLSALLRQDAPLSSVFG